MDLKQLVQSQQSVTAISLAVLVLVMFVAKRIFLVRMRDKARQEGVKGGFALSVVLALDAPLTVLIMVFSLWIVRYILIWFELIADPGSQILGHLCKAGVIVALFVFLERLCTYSLRRYQGQSEMLRNSKSIANGAIRAILASLTVLIVLSTLGISVTPIIASLGITSLAVALALQSTLENFFSGIQLVMDKPIRVGDFIELDSGEQGFVEKIGWRSTWIKMLPNNIVIMPNSKLSNSKLINYYYPEKELSVPVEVGVHYSSDLDKVESICLEVARDILRTHHYGVATYEPFVVFHTFDNSSINLTVMIRAQEYFNRFFIKSAFIKALKKRFDQEGIVIPFPITALNMDQENAAQLVASHPQVTHKFG
ncbi:mechanosensitive ion channel family protein [Alteromonas aestuariivivens]|uniref:Small-conductance mechanosensitive channel n=1 Tax=Alteromonas aestuariivivens TaxID=1938339 RepID=A0A3D8M312_9ALTE|nr:mechanosensitive ion channel family protein [Alteromonas aestuariivivens]RDV24117.1 mechanosensitive ion channel family protein [Alteromonas aestuariivivens]